MRRTIVVLLALCFAWATSGTLLASPAGKSRQRTETLSYQKPVFGATVTTPLSKDSAMYCNAQEPLVPTGDQGCVAFELKKGDRLIQIEVLDATTLPVQALVFDSTGTMVHEICGSDDKPWPSPGGYEIEVWIVAGNCGSSYMPSMPTTGDVVVTFSR